MFNFLFQGKVGEMMAPIKSPEAQLLIAIQNRQADKIRELLEVQGVSANSANDRGVRPMHMACQTGDMALVRRLLELGADITTADNAGSTPLHYASKGGHFEMVKMLVEQGVGVEKRNAARLTSYDVATDHIIRQFLLPLQLRAEAGNPEFAVHGMGITSDAPRNYEQYGVPGITQPSHGQPYSQQQHHDPSTGGADSMSAALGALMQAPGMGPPRPGAAPPTINAGGFVGTPPRHSGSGSPSNGGPGGYPVASAAFSTSLGVASSSPTASMAPPQAVASPPLPTPGSVSPPFSGAGASSASPPAFSPPPPGLPAAPCSNGVEERNYAANSTSVGDAPPAPPAASSSLPSPPGVAGHALPGGAVWVRQGTGASETAVSPAVSPRVAGTVDSSAIDAGVAGLFTFEAESFAVKPDVVVGRDGSAQASPLHLGGGKVFSGVPLGAQQQEGGGTAIAGAMASPRQRVGGVLAETSVPSGGVVSVDLSSRFQVQAAISGAPEVASNTNFAGAPPPPAVHPSSAPSSGQGRTVLPASRPQSVYTPGPGPHQPPREFKLIKPDGFHSSASDKELQARYGHTKIVRDMGAPPTAAQLGGPLGPPPGASYAGPPPMPGPSMAEPPRYGGYAQPPAQYGRPSGNYGQPFGGGAQNFSQQPFGQAPQHPHVHHNPPPPPAAHHGHGGQAFAPPLVNVNSHVGANNPLPTPGGYARPSVGVSAPPRAGFPPANNASGDGGRGARGGGYSVFNPSTDRVVAADSTSNAVL